MSDVLLFKVASDTFPTSMTLCILASVISAAEAVGVSPSLMCSSPSSSISCKEEILSEEEPALFEPIEALLLCPLAKEELRLTLLLRRDDLRLSALEELVESRWFLFSAFLFSRCAFLFSFSNFFFNIAAANVGLRNNVFCSSLVPPFNWLAF